MCVLAKMLEYPNFLQRWIVTCHIFQRCSMMAPLIRTKELLVVLLPLSLQQIHVAFQQAHEAPEAFLVLSKTKAADQHPEMSLSDVADVFKKNIPETTAKIKPDTHFPHPRLSILSWV